MTVPARPWSAGAAALTVAVALSACGGSSHSGSTAGGSSAPGATAGSATPGASRAVAAPLMVHSPAITAGGRIQRRYTCDGADLSPPLNWSVPPAATREIVVTMVDLDAPQPPFVHWALAGIPPGQRALGAGSVPPTSVPGANSFGGVGYRGPCPPRGDRPHRYRVEVWVLVQPVSVRRGFVLSQVQGQLAARAVAHGVLQGIYSR